MEEHVAKEHVFARDSATSSPKQDISGTCEVCGKIIFGKTQSSLKQRIQFHKRSVHEKKYVCSICGKAFGQTAGFTAHMKRCNVPNEDRRYRCFFQNCNKYFKNEKDLGCHKIYHKPPRFKCEKCSRPFYQFKDFRKHNCPLDTDKKSDKVY